MLVRILYDIWGSLIFYNISVSDQTHMDRIKDLLDKYGITDPVVDDTEGIFTDVYLDGLYKTLTSAGSASPVEAFKVCGVCL